jgi:two-component system sensor histidine kinase KdpD
MLNEGSRRSESRRRRGSSASSRRTAGAQTAAQIGELELVPLRELEYRGTAMKELDVDAVLARRPAVALVDELAHTNVPGSRNEKRWQDVEELPRRRHHRDLDAQHPASRVPERRGRANHGDKQRETIPDEVVRRADQVELVDMPPEAIRRRMAHGNIYPPERIDVALGNYSALGNLGALRGARARCGSPIRVEEALAEYRAARIETAVGDRETRRRRADRLADGDRLVRRPRAWPSAHEGRSRRRPRRSRRTGSRAARRAARAQRSSSRSSAGRTDEWSAPTSPRRCSRRRAPERDADRARAATRARAGAS